MVSSLNFTADKLDFSKPVLDIYSSLLNRNDMYDIRLQNAHMSRNWKQILYSALLLAGFGPK